MVECVEPSTEELLRKAGCDRIVCLSRFDAHFLSQELLNPGVQEVVDELLSNTGGQQIYLTPVRLDRTATFGDLTALCRAQGQMVLGVRRAGKAQLNIEAAFALQPGDCAITIGAGRPAPFVLA
ncbi:MAG: hypothetical protein ACYC9M_14135 [Desulfobulbaceae bacterium]